MSDSKTNPTSPTGLTDLTSQMDPVTEYLTAGRSASAERLRVILNAPVEIAFVAAFHMRNPNGIGERDNFKKTMILLHERYPSLTLELLDLIPYYGCWGDLFALCEEYPPFSDRILSITAKQLKEDHTCTDGITECAKWAPRETKRPEVAKRLASILFPTSVYSTRMALYRRLVAGLNRRLKTVETFMCSGRWAEIDHSMVPVRARKKYCRAFLNLNRDRDHRADPDRVACRENFLAFSQDQAFFQKVNLTMESTEYDQIRDRIVHDYDDLSGERSNLDKVDFT